MDTFLSDLIPSVRAVVEGEMEDLFEAAADGLLEESADDYLPLKPIHSDPDMWELRLKALKAYRFYHGEPSRYPSLLVKLHRHIKDGKTDQQAEIEAAIARYRARSN
ncbi:hypothetical protein PQI51_03095 [Microbacterium esteraromaticum]|uniref:hypothetical protein n=1 Tax=Microbacterium esteraromaticum TaxID=57043 RepID=UPI00309BCB03